MIIQQTTQFKLCTKDYMTTMYPAWEKFLLSENLGTNPDILECIFSSVQSLSCVQLFATSWITAHQASMSITNSQSLLKLMSIDMSYYNKSKECLKVVKILLDPLP